MVEFVENKLEGSVDDPLLQESQTNEATVEKETIRAPLSLDADRVRYFSIFDYEKVVVAVSTEEAEAQAAAYRICPEQGAECNGKNPNIFQLRTTVFGESQSSRVEGRDDDGDGSECSIIEVQGTTNEKTGVERTISEERVGWFTDCHISTFVLTLCHRYRG